ncbi:MAG: pantoate--beta-alanine ligase [Bacteroidales bacterium]|nr:pantoate--beta-alanine ligase [Bacteroidales bacterium]MBR6161381.1 pantoate--beta-alanine ligase [Bacteroidales bacterium]
MQVINTVKELLATAISVKASGKTIGMVPTMGALHEGHLSLIRRARKENEAVFVSIFVNPVQFNNPDDLRKYPRTLERDLELIGEDADYVFAPSVEEVFPVQPSEVYDFGPVEKVMEGAARPGHFNGVGVIVRRLLEWVRPDKAYFGEKDYQQIAVIREMVRQCNIQSEIVPCPIVREPNGLAMSSRNRRLTPHQFETAANIHRILEESRQQPDVREIRTFVETEINKVPEFRLEYFEIADAQTLQSVQTLDDADGVMGFITVYVGEVRLIDNIRYK